MFFMLRDTHDVALVRYIQSVTKFGKTWFRRDEINIVLPW